MLPSTLQKTAMPLLSRLLRPFSLSASSLSLNPNESSASGDSNTQTAIPANAEKCTVAAGCFWGVEHLFRKQFKGKGLLDAKVGYIGGDTKNPGYRAVCTGRTGHAEALQILFDPTQLTYRSLLEFFFKMHDPTTKNRQGMDTGTQYRSAIFWHGDQQEAEAKKVLEQVQKQWFGDSKKVETEVVPAGEWWDAEQYHQLYLSKNPGGYECPAHFVRGYGELRDE